jgi:cytoplasmic iron level regulating protein YaaA (DUF328/UPF0246 family)
MHSLYRNANKDGQRNVIALSTAAGTTLYAFWKQKKDRWHIVEARNERNPDNMMVVDVLTSRQFQDAIEKGYYYFE